MIVDYSKDRNRAKESEAATKGDQQFEITARERPLKAAGGGYSTYGHSRRRSRDGRRHQQTSSSSSSESALILQ